MREYKIIALFILLIAVLVACGPEKILYKEGSYEGVGEAYHGTIKVLVTTDQYRIKEIKVIDEEPVPVVSDIVYEKIPERVIKKNSTEVDVIAGATSTSNGLLNAIRDALNKAKAGSK